MGSSSRPYVRLLIIGAVTAAVGLAVVIPAMSPARNSGPHSMSASHFAMDVQRFFDEVESERLPTSAGEIRELLQDVGYWNRIEKYVVEMHDVEAGTVLIVWDRHNVGSTENVIYRLTSSGFELSVEEAGAIAPQVDEAEDGN